MLFFSNKSTNFANLQLNIKSNVFKLLNSHNYYWCITKSTWPRQTLIVKQSVTILLPTNSYNKQLHKNTTWTSTNLRIKLIKHTTIIVLLIIELHKHTARVDIKQYLITWVKNITGNVKIKFRQHSICWYTIKIEPRANFYHYKLSLLRLDVAA